MRGVTCTRILMQCSLANVHANTFSLGLSLSLNSSRPYICLFPIMQSRLHIKNNNINFKASQFIHRLLHHLMMCDLFLTPSRYP